MDRWIERFSNLAVLIVAGLAIAVFVGRLKPTAELSASPPKDYATGDTVDITKLGITEPTILLVTRSSCPACTVSLPFYRQLSNIPIRAIAAEDTAKNKEYLSSNGVHVQSVMSLEDSGLKLRATPALMLVAADGRIMKSWVGRLAPSQEKELIAAIARRQ